MANNDTDLYKAFEKASKKLESERQLLVAPLSEYQQKQYDDLLKKQELERQQFKKNQQNQLREDIERKKKEILQDSGNKYYDQRRDSKKPFISDEKLTEKARKEINKENLDKYGDLIKLHEHEELNFLYSSMDERRKEHFQKSYNKVSKLKQNTKEALNDAAKNNQNMKGRDQKPDFER